MPSERAYKEATQPRPVAVAVGGFVVPLGKICWWAWDKGQLRIGVSHDDGEALETPDPDGYLNQMLLGAFRVLAI